MFPFLVSFINVFILSKIKNIKTKNRNERPKRLNKKYKPYFQEGFPIHALLIVEPKTIMETHGSDTMRSMLNVVRHTLVLKHSSTSQRGQKYCEK